ncbi:MAG TPA: universal stress protein [Macromonas sp.]|nr:universal stress protein [Macromonas sp.]
MKLLIPVDGSDVSLQAVRHGLRLVAQGLRGEVVLVNVQEPASLYEWMTLHDKDALRRVAEEAGQDTLALAEALLRAAAVPYSKEVLVGDPVAMLLEACEQHGCEAVIMGSHGTGGLRSAWAGSVSMGLLEKAPVPVTLVRED